MKIIKAKIKRSSKYYEKGLNQKQKTIWLDILDFNPKGEKPFKVRAIKSIKDGVPKFWGLWLSLEEIKIAQVENGQYKIPFKEYENYDKKDLRYKSCVYDIHKVYLCLIILKLLNLNKMKNLKKDSETIYRCKGKLHRDGDLPAVIYKDGSKEWYRNGKLHREDDKPAQVFSSGVKVWYKNGKIHREDSKPALVNPYGVNEYWENGKLLRKETTS